MNREQVREVLAQPLSIELLNSNIPARLAYTGLDGFPRAVPIAFYADSESIRLYSPTNAQKIPSLRERPEVALTIDTTGQTPPHILLIRGRASIEFVDGVPQEFIEASRKTMSREAFVGFEDTVSPLYKRMAKITVEPTWAKLIDFKNTLPEPIAELVQNASGEINR